jgi:hypothetical protein
MIVCAFPCDTDVENSLRHAGILRDEQSLLWREFAFSVVSHIPSSRLPATTSLMLLFVSISEHARRRYRRRYK